MNDLAIYSIYPNVVSIDAGTYAMDVNGNPVSIDESLVAAESMRMEEERQAQEEQQEAIMTALRNKLKALGLTAEEMQVIGVPVEDCN
jgi:1,6-anhydro-N-acetylmuramate kinase